MPSTPLAALDCCFAGVGELAGTARVLAGVSEVEFTDAPEMEGAVSVVTDSARLFIPMGELVDLEAERKRLQKELDKAEKELAGLSGKLSNPGFLNKAPANVVEAEKARAAALNEKIAKLRASL